MALENHFATRTSLISTGKELPIQIKANPISKLKQLKEVMTGEQTRHFRRRYGDILDLMDIEILGEALSALTQFWDNELRAFVFPHVLLSLVPEEYASFIGIPITPDTRGYEYPGYLPSRKNVASLLGLPTDGVTFQKIGTTDVLLLKTLEDRMNHLSNQGDWRGFNRVMALAIYGVILFPWCADSVSFEAISVFLAVEHHGVNPTSAILAETYGSLVMCKAGQGKKLRGCLQLLTVWLGNHWYGKDFFTAGRRPLKDFHQKEGQLLNKSKSPGSTTTSQWVRFFIDSQEENIKWKLTWWKSEEVLYSCGKSLNVPLVGPRYIVNYNTSLAHIQLAYQGKIPAKELLQPIFVHTQESQDYDLFKAWRQLNFKGKIELGNRMLVPAENFRLWLKQRLVSGTSFKYASLDPLQGNDLTMIDQVLKSRIVESKELCDSLDQQTLKKRKLIQDMEKEYVLLNRDLEELGRKKTTQKLIEENARLNSKIAQLEAALKEKEIDLRRAAKLSEEKQQMISQLAIQNRTVETQLVEVIMELENTQAKVSYLQVEDEVKGRAIRQRVEEIKAWKEEAERLQKKMQLMAGFLNKGVTSYIDLFQEAEWRIHVPATPLEIEKLLTTGRMLINDWNSICRIK